MKFSYYHTSDDWVSIDKRDTIEINSLEELRDFIKKERYSDAWFQSNRVIVNFDEMSLEIYDDYRE